jgi:hypothetical protein
MTQITESTSKSSFKLNVKQKNWLVSAHVASGAIWLGTGLCLVIMGVKNVDAPNGDALYAINEIAKFLDDFLIIPTATLSLVTGFFLSWFTNWGFVKHYWVITKWFLTVSAIVFGTFWIGPWINAMTSISAAERLQALQNLYVRQPRYYLGWSFHQYLLAGNYCGFITQALGSSPL